MSDRIPSKIVIRHSHLNPQFFLLSRSIHRSRLFRASGGVVAPVIFPPQNIYGVIGATIGAGVGLAAVNPSYASRIQKRYGELNFNQPIFLPNHERDYPPGWANAETVQKTHPIYYFDARKNLVFLRPTRTEYYRYLYQRSKMGRLGYHTWWLRGYLTPPKAPESWKKWATEKLQKVRERLAPEPLPSPAMVRHQAQRLRPTRIRYLRARRA